MVVDDKASKDVISHIQSTFLKEDLFMTVGAAGIEGVQRVLKWFMEKRKGSASGKVLIHG
jgi:hypothetical protein